MVGGGFDEVRVVPGGLVLVVAVPGGSLQLRVLPVRAAAEQTVERPGQLRAGKDSLCRGLVHLGGGQRLLAPGRGQHRVRPEPAVRPERQQPQPRQPRNGRVGPARPRYIPEAHARALRQLILCQPQQNAGEGRAAHLRLRPDGPVRIAVQVRPVRLLRPGLHRQRQQPHEHRRHAQDLRQPFFHAHPLFSQDAPSLPPFPRRTRRLVPLGKIIPQRKKLPFQGSLFHSS